MRRLVMALAVTCLASAGPSLADTRVALVIGNAKYATKPLQNPVNDARLVESTLKDMGFQVERIENATLDDMRHAARAFLKKSQEADIALFYYAGHAAQVRGNNYLAPIDGKVVYEDELESRGLNVNEEIAVRLDRRGRQGQLSIVVLDACRDNPFQSRKRSMAQGLADPSSKPEGMLLAFSTSPGDTALDSPEFKNSRYTAHLADAMRIPGLEVRDVFARVRDAVTEETRGSRFNQTPWFNSSVSSTSFCFVRTRDGKCGGVAPPPLVMAKNALKASAARSLGDTEVGRPANDPLSVTLLYRLFDEAEQLRPDDLKRWNEEASRGDPYAMTVLGIYSETHHQGSDWDRPEAVRWLRKAVEQGYPPAQYELGFAYKSGWATGQPEPAAGRDYFAIGVKQGYAPAQNGFAELISDAEPKSALALYQKAAEQGLARAMGNLAIMYLKGRGAVQDTMKAEQWARKSYAANSSDMSQHILGYMFAKGFITPSDDMDRLRLNDFARLGLRNGFAFGLE